MSVETVIAQEGDTVDLIAFRRFGVHGAEAAIWAANPGLAAAGPLIPIGTKVLVPVPDVQDRKSAQEAWS